MHNFKLNKWVAVGGTIAMIAVAECGLRVALKPWTMADELAFDLEDIEKSGQDITCIVLGDSTSRAEIDPVRLDQTLAQDSLTINASYNGQILTSEKYNMLDLIERYPIDTVVICLDYFQLRNEGSHFTEGYVMERIKTPAIYVQAVEGLFGWDKLQYALPSFRYRDKVGSMKRNLQYHLLPKEERFKLKDSTRGYSPEPDNGSVQGGAEIYSLEMDEGEIVPKLEESLSDMIAICHEKGIDVYLIGMPMASTTLVNSFDSLSEVHTYVSAMAKECGTTFYDLNLMKNRQEILDGAELHSVEHMTEVAVPGITDLVAEIINADKSGQDMAALLYDTPEAARSGLSGIVGMNVGVSRNEDGSAAVSVQTVTAVDDAVEYEYCKEANGIIDVIQSYTGDNSCTIPASEIEGSDSLLVRAKTASGHTMWRKTAW